MTIHAALKYTAEKLESIYENSEAGKMAEMLFEHLTGYKKNELSLYKDKELPNEKLEKLNNYLPRLLNHEPIHYVLNECWFYGLKFYVDKNVLIPRPETEELVDWIIRNLRFPFAELKILDIGTGSGCIAVSLKRKLRKAEVWACDISKEALNVAKQNSLNLQAEINFVQLDFLNEEETDPLPSFDIIVSNPPYVPHRDKATMQNNVLDFEPHSALFVPNDNALIFYSAITDFSKTHLKQNGTVYCEIHESLAKNVMDLFERNGFRTELKKDMQGKERMVKVIRKDYN